VRRVVNIAGLPNPTHLRPGVAVVADSTWAALQGKAALEVTWEHPAPDSTDALRERCLAAAESAPGKILRGGADFDEALSHADEVLDATYEVPFLAHVTLEPMNCVADVRDGRCEIWGPMQMPMSARSVVAAATGLAEDRITIHMTRVGGGFGRRLLADYVGDAAAVSQAIGGPVQVVWSREDDIRHDYYRPAGLHRVRAGLDAGGELLAWSHHLINVSRNAHRLDPRPPELTEIYGLLAPRSADAAPDLDLSLTPCLIPAVQLAYTEMKTPIPTGAWRAPAHNANAFVVHSFLNEIAHAASVDPLELTLKMLGSTKDFPVRGAVDRRYEADRLRGVLELAAAKVGWGTPPPAGRARGIAGHYTFGSYAATVAEISVDAKRRITIHRFVIAVDCGLPVNLSGVEAQAEGGVLDGLSAAMFGEITVRDGQTQEGSFDAYRLLRCHEAPPVEVHIVPSRASPTGFGEIALPTVAPALGNAIFAATGVRVRALPFEKAGFTV
jgi:isoquinoline 1-oxidoreductase beta subunit